MDSRSSPRFPGFLAYARWLPLVVGLVVAPGVGEVDRGMVGVDAGFAAPGVGEVGVAGLVRFGRRVLEHGDGDVVGVHP